MNTGTRAIKRVATHNWLKDGCPERVHDDPTSVGRGDYAREAERVVRGLIELGYTIKQPGAKRAKGGAK